MITKQNKNPRTYYRIQNMLNAWDDRFAETIEGKNKIVEQMKKEGIPICEISIVEEVMNESIEKD